MAETVLKALEMAILTGELKPRERLTESELVRRFKAKRFAVRKAIQELSHRGLVEVFPNKGARVADISDKEVEDAYQVRMALELLAAELLVERMTPHKLAQIKKVQKEYMEAVRKGTIEEMVLKNEAFHRTLYRMSENRFLAEHLEKITNAIFALRYNAYFLLGIAPKTVKDHEAMIDAIERRDAEGLKKALREGIIYPKMIYLSRRMNPFSTEHPQEGLEEKGKSGQRKKKSAKIGSASRLGPERPPKEVLVK
jgi:DNA-binding GntR family transcriptional regulator